jgi:hypothetical protein
MLKLLSDLKPGDTINVSTMSIVNHNSYFTSLKRWVFNENRHKTLIEIENSITDVLYSLKSKFNMPLFQELLKSSTGLQSLLLTYNGDEVSMFRLMKCIKIIESYKLALEESWDGDPKKLDEIHLIFHKVFQDRKQIREICRTNESSHIWNTLTSNILSISSKLVSNELSKVSNQRKIIKYVAPIVIKKMFFPNIGDNMFFLIAFKFIFNQIT